VNKNAQLQEEIKSFFEGDISSDLNSRNLYSHDASLFEIKPELVVYPRDSDDLGELVNYVTKNKKSYPGLSLTARSGGTDMGGGAINDSIIVAFERYFTRVGRIQGDQVSVQPGVYYRDFEPKTLDHGLLMPSYPASRDLCMIGGMVANNAGGEKSLVYGKTDRYVDQVKIVLRDGKQHTFRPISNKELINKLKEKGIEGDIYRAVHTLLKENSSLIERSKPKVSKNATGYNVWDVWKNETFDITKLIVGSQGTLGLVTDVTFRLVDAKELSGMVVIFLKDLKSLGQIINDILPLKPTSLESFDDHTLKFAFRFFFSFRKTLGWKRFVLLGLSFLPVLKHLLIFLPSFPKIIMLCEFEGEVQSDIDEKINRLQKLMDRRNIETQLAVNKHQEEKFWVMRRESFNLLRKNVKRKHTAPFIDDLIVPPDSLPEFLPRLTEILERHKLLYTVAGHMGDGNFHIIPLMNLQDPTERQKIYPVLREVTDLVLEYGGSLSGEHNDGLIRGPMLERMYGPDMMNIFSQIKHTFDPDNIFNPHKKTDAKLEFSQDHMRKSFK